MLVAPFKDAVSRWVNAQTWEQLRRGELAVPYTDLAKGWEKP